MDGVRFRGLCGTPQERALVRWWFLQAAEILAAVHDCGVSHRDLKPENLMLDSEGRVRVIDFGIASVRLSGERSTWAKRLAGSLEYMAPEQLYGQSRPATDVYALALILVECLTGRRVAPEAAERGETVAESAERLLREAGMADLAVRDALTFDPEQRMADPRVLAKRI